MITYKGPCAHGLLTRRTEIEVPLNPAGVDNASQLLAALGFHTVLSFEKLRTTWKVDTCLVEIDRVPYVGDFVEIETASEEAILAIRQKLNLDQEPMLQSSYIAMLCAYLEKNNLCTNRVELSRHQIKIDPSD